jgi:hypothetical protein
MRCGDADEEIRGHPEAIGKAAKAVGAGGECERVDDVGGEKQREAAEQDVGGLAPTCCGYYETNEHGEDDEVHHRIHRRDRVGEQG